jgi:hypothetical protein
MEGEGPMDSYFSSAWFCNNLFQRLHYGRCLISPDAGLGVDPNSVGRGGPPPPSICVVLLEAPNGLLGRHRCIEESGVVGIDAVVPPALDNFLIPDISVNAKNHQTMQF